MLTRREFGWLTLAGLASLKSDLTFANDVNGVHLGVQTYSFRDLPRSPGGDAVDTVINAMKQCGLTECELWSPQVEPQFSSGRGGGGARGQRGGAPSSDAQRARDDARKWRLETPIDHFKDVKKKFDAAGITIYAYNYSFNTNMNDEEIARGFEMAKALGAEIITASTTLEVAKRVAPHAERARMVVAMHGHSNVKDPNEFATPDSFAAAMKMSKYFKVNLDIGHFTAADFDAVSYIREHHADITNLHLKDRKKHEGDNTPWGEGDTPIKDVLQLLKKERWPIRAYIEYEYRGQGTPVEEVKKCFAYAKEALV